MLPILRRTFRLAVYVSKRRRLAQYVSIYFLLIRDVVSRQWHGSMIVGKLKLEYHTFLHTEKIFTTDKIKFSRADKLIVIIASDSVNVIVKTESSVAQGFSVMVQHDFDIKYF